MSDCELRPTALALSQISSSGSTFMRRRNAQLALAAVSAFVSRDGKGSIITLEYATDCINVEVEGDTVVRAFPG